MFWTKQIFVKYELTNASGIRLKRFMTNASVDLPEYKVVVILVVINHMESLRVSLLEAGISGNVQKGKKGPSLTCAY